MASRTLPRSILLVSEEVEHESSVEPEWNIGLEMSSRGTTQDVVAGLRTFTERVAVIPGPEHLAAHCDLSPRPLVMTIYGGAGSRNRMALVPATCEALGLPYMGADAYNRVVCQDKYLSKIIAREIGLDTSPAVLVRDVADLPLINALTPRLVVKPNLEGSSIGIGAKNLVTTHEAAKKLALELLARFRQPILVEEFVPGREVCFCVSGDESGVNFLQAVEDIHTTQEGFFRDQLYSADIKQNRWNEMGHRLVTDEMTGALRDTLCRLFSCLGKVDYVRVDCRIDAGACKLIEITPDPFLARDGSFGEAFELSGLGYENGLRMLVSNSVRS